MSVLEESPTKEDWATRSAIKERINAGEEVSEDDLMHVKRLDMYMRAKNRAGARRFGTAVAKSVSIRGSKFNG